MSLELVSLFSRCLCVSFHTLTILCTFVVPSNESTTAKSTSRKRRFSSLWLLLGQCQVLIGNFRLLCHSEDPTFPTFPLTQERPKVLLPRLRPFGYRAGAHKRHVVNLLGIKKTKLSISLKAFKYCYLPSTFALTTRIDKDLLLSGPYLT